MLVEKRDSGGMWRSFPVLWEGVGRMERDWEPQGDPKNKGKGAASWLPSPPFHEEQSKEAAGFTKS